MKNAPPAGFFSQKEEVFFDPGHALPSAPLYSVALPVGIPDQQRQSQAD
jgi:hypothetical protein